MSRFNRVSSISQQEKQKIIFVTSDTISSGSSSRVFETRPGIYKLDSQFNYNVSFDTKDPVSKIAFNTSGALDIKIDNSFNIYAVGNFTQFRGLPNNRIIKLLPNGSKDTSFDNTTGFNSTGTVSKVYLDTNNKIYCFGAFTTYKGVSANRIIRLNPDGSKDTTFDNTTGFNGNVLDYTVDSLGKIYCVGTFTSYKGVSCGRIAKINTDGTLDTAFNFGGTGFSSTQVTNICIDNNDKIYVGGNFNQYNGVNANGIIRLNNDGTIDNGFNYGSGFLPLSNLLVRNIKVDVDNNLYVSVQNSSSLTKYKNSTNSNGLWKIDPSGNTISNLNYPPNVSGPQNIVFTNDNKIIMNINSYNGFGTVPYNVILTDLNGNKIKNLLYTNVDYNISYDSNNNYYIYGDFIDDGVFNRAFSMGYPISENGLLLPKKFNQNYGLTSGGTTSSNNNIIITSDNKLIYGYNIYSYNFKENRNFLKLTLNGSVDNRFNTGSGFNTLEIGFNSKIDSDLNGDLFVISSTFTKYKNETIRSTANGCAIIKIDKNGNRDTTFQPVITNTNAFLPQQMWFQKNDNKLIWIANRGSNVNVTISGNTYNGIVRFNNNGLIDTTFSGRTWSSSPSISASYLHNDNKLYLATSSNGLTYGGIPVGCICRLNNDGSLDQTFNTSIETINVNGIFVDKYDKVWAYGSFTTYSGITNNRIIRLNSDGTIDGTFDNSIGFNSSVVDMCFDNDNDKTYFLGGFTTYKNISVPYLASLNYNGSINSTFTTPKNNGYGAVAGKIFIFDS